MSVLSVGGLLVISGKEWTRRLSVGAVQFFHVFSVWAGVLASGSLGCRAPRR